MANAAMILSHKHKFIFFCNGKTGTTSIEHVLEPLNEGQSLAFRALGLFPAKHIPAAILRACVPRRTWVEYYKFVFVRNPYDWFVSQWKHNFKARDPGRRYAVPWITHSPEGRLLYMGKPAEELVHKEIFGAGDVDLLYQFLASFHRTVPYAPACFQASHVFDCDGEMIVDFVGRFETLITDFAQVTERLGLELELPHLNRTAHRPYRAYFTDASAARVRSLWKRDFELLGYSAQLDDRDENC
jgi:hypothetical protein